MDKLTNAQIQKKRAEAQAIDVTFHVGKGGVTPAAVEELSSQLKKRKLVKARLLSAATEGGSQDKDQAQALAEATRSVLIETRGHTAVFFRP
jgi:RNA-binding protein